MLARFDTSLSSRRRQCPDGGALRRPRVRRGGLGACALAAALLAAAPLGCGRDLEGEFIADRALDPCIQTVPACPSLIASCVLDASRYARVIFPDDAPFRFLVPAREGDVIEVALFFSRRQYPGLLTSIYWNEPGCADVQRYDSEGRDLFDEADRDGVVSRQMTALSDGEHLIELLTDMQAEVLVAATVHEAR